jgi:hypothetical protein
MRVGKLDYESLVLVRRCRHAAPAIRSKEGTVLARFSHGLGYWLEASSPNERPLPDSYTFGAYD